MCRMNPLRVIAGRWAITTMLPLPFDHALIEAGFRSAQAQIAECLRIRKLPMGMRVDIRLTWVDGRVSAAVLREDRELGECAAQALEAATWPALTTGTLDVIVAMREGWE